MSNNPQNNHLCLRAVTFSKCVWNVDMSERKQTFRAIVFTNWLCLIIFFVAIFALWTLDERNNNNSNNNKCVFMPSLMNCQHCLWCVLWILADRRTSNTHFTLSCMKVTGDHFIGDAKIELIVQTSSIWILFDAKGV